MQRILTMRCVNCGTRDDLVHVNVMYGLEQHNLTYCYSCYFYGEPIKLAHRDDLIERYEDIWYDA